MTTWQPIATAPTGVAILLYYRKHDDMSIETFEPGEDRSIWAIKPTHWMPLPAPPEVV